MAHEWKRGDACALIRQDVVMTVYQIDTVPVTKNVTLHCYWFTNDGKLQRAWFDADLCVPRIITQVIDDA